MLRPRASSNHAGRPMVALMLGHTILIRLAGMLAAIADAVTGD